MQQNVSYFPYFLSYFTEKWIFNKHTVIFSFFCVWTNFVTGFVELINVTQKNILLVHQACDWNAGPVHNHGKLFWFHCHSYMNCKSWSAINENWNFLILSLVSRDAPEVDSFVLICRLVDPVVPLQVSDNWIWRTGEIMISIVKWIKYFCCILFFYNEC